MEAVVQSTVACKDVPRLCTAAGVLTQIMSVPEDESLQYSATEAVLKLLTCPFPKARIQHRFCVSINF